MSEGDPGKTPPQDRNTYSDLFREMALRDGMTPKEKFKRMVGLMSYLENQVDLGGVFTLTRANGETVVVDFHSRAGGNLVSGENIETD